MELSHGEETTACDITLERTLEKLIETLVDHLIVTTRANNTAAFGVYLAHLGDLEGARGAGRVHDLCPAPGNPTEIAGAALIRDEPMPYWARSVEVEKLATLADGLNPDFGQAIRGAHVAGEVPILFLADGEISVWSRP